MITKTYMHKLKCECFLGSSSFLSLCYDYWFLIIFYIISNYDVPSTYYHVVKMELCVTFYVNLFGKLYADIEHYMF